jgi:hypothetical protein
MDKAEKRKGLEAIAHFERCIESTIVNEERDKRRINKLNPRKHPTIKGYYVLGNGEILKDSSYYENQRKIFAKRILALRLRYGLERKHYAHS